MGFISLAMEVRRTYPHQFLSTEPNGSKEAGKKEQLRKDWGYTNQYRRMMQRRNEQKRELSSED